MKNNNAKTIIIECVKKFFEMHISGSAAELSYYLLFSVFSLIMATSAVAFSAGIAGSVFVYLTDIFVPGLISDIFSDYSEHIGSVGLPAWFSVGVLLSLYAVARYIKCLKRKIREIYGTPRVIEIWKEWLLSLGFSVIMVLGFVFTFVFLLAGERLLVFVSEKLFFIPENTVHSLLILRFAVTGLYIFSLLVLIYRTIPGVKASFYDLRAGAFLSTVAWVLVSSVFSFYVDNLVDYTAVYGSLGAFVVLMLWLYGINSVILIGALINKVKLDENSGNCQKIFL